VKNPATAESPASWIAHFPESVRHTLAADLNDISQWLRCTPQQLVLRQTSLPLTFFHQTAEDMLATFDEFPEDEARMQKILAAIRNGAPVLPVFIEDGDEHHFIMEGRHRIVAFYLAGIKAVPVAFVCKNRHLECDSSPSP